MDFYISSSETEQDSEDVYEDIIDLEEQEDIKLKKQDSAIKLQTKRKRKKKLKSLESNGEWKEADYDLKKDTSAGILSVHLTPTNHKMPADVELPMRMESPNAKGFHNNGYSQREVLLDTSLTPVAGDMPVANSKYLVPQKGGKASQNGGAITVNGESGKKVFKMSKSAANVEVNEELETLSPTVKLLKQNGIAMRVSPRRTASFPSRHLKRSDSSTSSKWTAVKHAVKLTQTMTKQHKSKQDSFMEKFNTNRRVTESLLHPMEVLAERTAETDKLKSTKKTDHTNSWTKFWLTVFHPDGNFLFFWLMVLTITVEYNLWILILRQAFPTIQKEFSSIWFSLDALADLIYVVDILVQLRTGFLEDGLLVTKHKRLALHYLKSRYLAMDLLSVLPLDFFQFAFGLQPMLRFPRFIKIYRSVQFFYIFENQATYPNVLRVSNLTHILLLLCHWFAAFYYIISKSEGLAGTWVYAETNETSFSQTTRLYLKSLYWSTLTLTTIGDLPTPESNWQHSWTHHWYLFQILSYLIGVFVFATIVGQVGNSINNYNATRSEYEQLLDGAKLYMRKHEVPKAMQVRVQRWCDYAWSRGRMQGALDINSLKMLPDRLKTELALHVHLDILKQVSIFDDCEPEFLHDLVLKMKTYIFTPGDMVVRKGEIAREMFIIADGHLEVIGEKSKIIARLSTGNFFGEIGILNLDGGINRRTADVTSVGYSELFVLKREDIVRAIKYYPSAKASLMRHAKKRLAEMREQNTAISESVIQDNPPEIHTVFISEDEQSAATKHLSVPKRCESPSPESTPRRSRHSRRDSTSYSIRSNELDNDTMDECDSQMEQVRENELVAKLTEELDKKNEQVDRLTEELSKLNRTLEATLFKRDVPSTHDT